MSPLVYQKDFKTGNKIQNRAPMSIDLVQQKVKAILTNLDRWRTFVFVGPNRVTGALYKLKNGVQRV